MFKKRHGGSRVSHVPSWRILQVRFHPHTVWSSLARTDSDGFLAPCLNVKQKKGSFTSMQMWHTHTHPAEAGFFLEEIQRLWSAARISVYLRYSGMTWLQSVSKRFSRWIQKLNWRIAAELGSRLGSSCVPAVCFLLTFWSANRALATVLRAFCRQLLQTEPQTHEHGNHFTRKNRVSRPKVFSSLNSHAAELLHFPTTWWWVVDIMMCLAWWWDC